MGRQQRVLVAHAGFPDRKGSVMVYAVGMAREEFAAILAGITAR
jgi:hypothetical protein